MASRLCSRCGATTAGAPGAPCPACLLRLAALPESRVPAFEIETLLGSGSGTTYLARAIGTGALLAVKTFGAVAAESDAAEAIDALEPVLLAFHHAGVAKTHALDVDADGTVRLIRDFVRGRAFADWMASAPPEDRRATLAALGETLARAHEHGLAHGNLAAANVVVTGGRPVLLDLGAHLALEILERRQPDIAAMQRQDLARLRAL